MYCTKCNITVLYKNAYCDKCGSALVAVAPLPVPADRPIDEILSLKLRIAEIEARLNRSKMFSAKFLARAMAVFGHVIAGYLVIILFGGLIGLVFAILETLFS